MGAQTWVEIVNIQIGAGPTLTAATTEALCVTDVVIPANYMQPGRIIRGQLAGKASSAITTPGTGQLRIRFGGLAGTLLADSGQMAQRAASAATNETWILDFLILCQTNGASGTFLSYGRMNRQNRENAASTNPSVDIIPTASLAAVSVDTTTQKNLSITWTASLATASFTAMSYFAEVAN